jgi:hypothetical protein
MIPVEPAPEHPDLNGLLLRTEGEGLWRACHIKTCRLLPIPFSCLATTVNRHLTEKSMEALFALKSVQDFIMYGDLAPLSNRRQSVQRLQRRRISMEEFPPLPSSPPPWDLCFRVPEFPEQRNVRESSPGSSSGSAYYYESDSSNGTAESSNSSLSVSPKLLF